LCLSTIYEKSIITITAPTGGYFLAFPRNALGSPVCKTCNTVLFSLEAVAEHKAMTGHWQYEKRGKEPTVRDKDDE
jgi:hypothetical protein